MIREDEENYMYGEGQSQMIISWLEKVSDERPYSLFSCAKGYEILYYVSIPCFLSLALN